MQAGVGEAFGCPVVKVDLLHLYDLMQGIEAQVDASMSSGSTRHYLVQKSKNLIGG